MLKRLRQNFNLLVDLSFWGLTIWQLRALALTLGVPRELLLAGDSAANTAIRAAVIAVQLGSIVLILMRRLRDEYAERLWHQAAGTYTKLLVLSPLLWMPLLLIFQYHESGFDWYIRNPKESLLPLGMRMPNSSGSLGMYQLEAINFLMAKLVAYLPLTFLGLYKWHRWRDSR